MMTMSKRLVDDAKLALPEKLSGMYSLYFKGLVSEDKTLSGFGVAICGQKDDVLFQMKGPIHGSSSDITVLEAELTALKRGLTEAVSLNINHLSIYCDCYLVYELIMGRSVPAQESKIVMLMDDVQRIREEFESSFPIYVARISIKHAYKLAEETIVSEISIPVNPPPRKISEISIPVNHPPRKAKAIKKKSCGICLDDDINADEMFFIEKCRHRFCSECVRRHIEVRLVEGSVMRCPQYRCKSRLLLQKCDNLLTPEMRKMWVQRIREDSIAVVDRIYCPYPQCSALMSKTEVLRSSSVAGVRGCCFKCRGYFCVECKVLWHNGLSCGVYKRLHPNATENDEKLKALASEKLWRQCPKCQHMIELSQGCVRVSCRCGHTFCYRCGAGAGSCAHGHGVPPRPPRNQTSAPPNAPACCLVLCILCCLFGLLCLACIIYLRA